MAHAFSKMTRRQLLQTAAASALWMGMPTISGCTSIPKYQPSGVDKGKALYLTHSDIVDVIHGVILHDRTIVVRNGYIEAIKDQIPSPREGDMVMDLKNKFVIPGLIDAHCHATMPGESAFNPSGVLTTMHQLKRNYVQQIKHGVTTVRDMGSGVPLAYHGTLWREMEMLGRIGFTNAEVLQCATINNAKIIGMADKIGSVEVGKYADLTILQENPLKKIETCRKPQMVVKNGEVYDVDKIKFNS